MPNTLKQLGQAAITTSAATAYTVASGTTMINTFDVTNTGASATTFDVYLVPNGGTAGTGNAIVYQIPIKAKGVYHWVGMQVLHTIGDTIQVKAAATGCTITISGVEVT
jgi:hypothetical protein